MLIFSTMLLSGGATYYVHIYVYLGTRVYGLFFQLTSNSFYLAKACEYTYIFAKLLLL